MALKPNMSIVRGFARMDWKPWGTVCLVLLACGGVYQVTMAKYRPLMERKIALSVPLSIFPLAMGDWTGEDRPLTPEVLQIAGNDDYVNRLYADRFTGEWAHFYIAYSGRPRTMVGHRPQVCYVSAGWVHDGTEESRIALPSGITLPCLVHRFHQPPPNSGDIFVLNYYVLNGVPTDDESSFTGVGWRLPNIEGNPAWYVAQIEVSSVSEAATRKFAALTGDEVLARLPDKDGKVRAAFTAQRDSEANGGGPGGV